MTMQGDELKRLRKRAKMTQGEFATALGLTGTFVGMMERGDKAIERRTELSALALGGEVMKVKMMKPGGSWIGEGFFEAMPKVGDDLFIKATGHHTVVAVMHEGNDDGFFSPMILIEPVKA